VMANIPAVILVAIGGAMGAVTRYLTYLGIKAYPTLPSYAATLTVNLLGCLLIGVAMTVVEQHGQLQRELLMILVVGFLGSYTTFSTLGWESFNLISSGAIVSVMVSIAANMIVGILAVWIGRSLTLSLIS
jgi:fluoride exporter